MMHKQLVAVSAVEDLDHVRSLATAGDRMAAVYAAHKRLEEDVAELSVLLASTRKRYEPTGAASWTTLAATIESFCHDVELCLQLFSMSVKIELSKGLRTVSILYDQQKNPAERLRCFFVTVHKSFSVDDAATPTPMPAAVVGKFAQAVRVFDAKQAYEWLECGVHSMLDASRTLPSPDAPLPPVNVCRLLVFGGDHTAGLPARGGGGAKPPMMLSMLTLLIQCGAEAGKTCTLVHERNSDLREWMDEDALESLMRFEFECVTMMRAKRERIRQRAERRVAGKQAASPPQAALLQTREMSNAPAGDTAPLRQLLRCSLDQLLGRGWGWHPSRIALLVAEMIILILLARRLASSLASGWGSIRGSSAGVRRTLTL